MSNATCIINSRSSKAAGLVQRTVRVLPKASAERPHGLKNRLFCGDATHCLVRYDNEAGKGDHRHYGQHEEPCTFTTLEALLEDFQADVIRLTQSKP